MTSVAFSMPDDRRRRVSLRRRSTNTVTQTSVAADEALQQVMTRRAQKRDGRVSGLRSTTSVHQANLREAVSWASSGSNLLKVVAMAVAVVAMWAGLSLRATSPFRGVRHAVQGVLVFEGKPLAHSIVEFHRLDAAVERGGAAEAASTDGGGMFRFGTAQTPGLAAGTYAVVARARRNVVRGGESVLESVPLPKAYSSPEATPLRVTVPADVSLQLVIQR